MGAKPGHVGRHTTMLVLLAVEKIPYLVRTGLTVLLWESIFRCCTVGASKKHNAENRRVIAVIKLLAIAHSTLVGTLALTALTTDDGLRSQTLKMLRFEPIANAGLFVSDIGYVWANLLTSITVGFFVWELGHIADWAPSSKMDAATMVIHHVISSLLWPLSIRLRIAYFYLVHFEFTELSSPFLQLRWFVKVYGGPEMLASSAFALSFFAVRTLLIVPMLRAIYLSRPWDGILYPHLSLTVRIISIVSLCIPFFLNAIWTVQIVQMGFKTYRRTHPKKNGKDS